MAQGNPWGRRRLTVALVAHDRRKVDLLNWVRRNHRAVTRPGLVGSSSTARLLRSEQGLQLRAVGSGPHGGGRQIGSMVIPATSPRSFVWDPLWAAPHVHDVLALVRIAVLRNIPVALNPASAEAVSEDGFPLEGQVADPAASGVRSRSPPPRGPATRVRRPATCDRRRGGTPVAGPNPG
ncbi:methylglyoxal synthase [Streptomyces sp. H27-H1]|uniref:methylglyoxal synthase n=1 Tax=Streptomyces sp. H27-H1 TaxID=2996461 RepID=UPI003B63E4C9